MSDKGKLKEKSKKTEMLDLPVEILILGAVPVVVLAAFLPMATLYASVVFNTLLTGVEFGILYPRILVFLVLFISLAYRMFLFKERLAFPRHTKWSLIFVMLFAFWSLGVDIFYGLLSSEPSTILKRFSRTFLPIFILFCTFGICNSMRRIRGFLIFFIICTSLSAFIAFMQFLGIDFFWVLRTVQTKALGLAGQRVVGMANQAVGLSYVLALGFPWALSFVLSDELRQGWRRCLLFIPLLVLSIGTVVTLTRSALLGCLLGGVYLIWKFRGIQTVLVVIPLGVAIALVFAIGTGKFERLTTLEEGSAMGRIPLAITGLAFSAKHPLGIGSFDQRYLQSINAESQYYEGLVKGYKGAGMIFRYTCHNHYLLVLVYWGWIGLILVISMLFLLFSACRALLKTGVKNTGMHAYGIAFRGMLFAYLVNAFFHNGGPFTGGYLFWYFPGLLGAVLVQMETSKQSAEETKRSSSEKPYLPQGVQPAISR